MKTVTIIVEFDGIDDSFDNYCRDIEQELSCCWHSIESITVLNGGYEEQQWIPCSERLPKRRDETQMRGYYLTTNAYGSVGLTKYEFEGGGLGYAWDSDIRIVAWMPLPEAYKEVLD